MSSLLSPVSQKCTDPSSTKGQTLMQSSLMPSGLHCWGTGMPVALAEPLSCGLVVLKAGSCTGDSSWLFAA